MKAKELIEILSDYPEAEVLVPDFGVGGYATVNHVGTDGHGGQVVLQHEKDDEEKV